MKNTIDTTATPVCDALRESGNWNPNWDQFAGRCQVNREAAVEMK